MHTLLMDPSRRRAAVAAMLVGLFGRIGAVSMFASSKNDVHPGLAKARALVCQTPSTQVFSEILGALIHYVDRPHDPLPPWPDDRTLEAAVTEIDQALDATWPWELRECHSLIYTDRSNTKVHPTTRLLRKLIISRRSEGRSPNEELRALELGRLRSLTLSRLEFTVYLSTKPHLNALSHLRLSDVHVVEDEWRAMSRAAHLQTIEALELVDYSNLSAELLGTVLNGSLLHSVTLLALTSGTLFGSRLPELLTHRTTLSKLKILDLSGNEISDWHLAPLLEARWLDNLTVLDLRCRNLNKISPEGQQSLRNAPQFARTNLVFDPSPKPNRRY